MANHDGSPSPRALRQYLQDLERAGVTTLPRIELPEKPVAQPVSEGPITVARPAEPSPESPTTPNVADQSIEVTAQSQQPALPAHAGETPNQPLQDQGEVTTSAEERLAALADRVAACTRCELLAEARTQTVFGVGDPNANLMFIGEAPGADEDRLGEPFVGRAGQLLDRIIVACKMTREEIYICNILRCRPPGNRNPSQQEADNCREYLNEQIQIVNPEYIVCWGTVAAQNLLGMNRPIGKMRKQFFQFGTARVLCTYHPSYLLRNPSAKKDVWDDMKFLFAEMGVNLEENR